MAYPTPCPGSYETAVIFLKDGDRTRRIVNRRERSKESPFHLAEGGSWGVATIIPKWATLLIHPSKGVFNVSAEEK